MALRRQLAVRTRSNRRRKMPATAPTRTARAGESRRQCLCRARARSAATPDATTSTAPSPRSAKPTDRQISPSDMILSLGHDRGMKSTTAPWTARLTQVRGRAADDPRNAHENDPVEAEHGQRGHDHGEAEQRGRPGECHVMSVSGLRRPAQDTPARRPMSGDEHDRHFAGGSRNAGSHGTRRRHGQGEEGGDAKSSLAR